MARKGRRESCVSSVERTFLVPAPACLHKQETSHALHKPTPTKNERNTNQRAKVCQHAEQSCIKATNQTIPTSTTPKRRANNHMCPPAMSFFDEGTRLTSTRVRSRQSQRSTHPVKRFQTWSSHWYAKKKRAACLYLWSRRLPQRTPRTSRRTRVRWSSPFSNSSRWPGRAQPPASEPLPTKPPATAFSCTELLYPCGQTSTRRATVAGAVPVRSRADPRRWLEKLGKIFFHPPPRLRRQQPSAGRQGRRSFRALRKGCDGFVNLARFFFLPSSSIYDNQVLISSDESPGHTIPIRS